MRNPLLGALAGVSALSFVASAQAQTPVKIDGTVEINYTANLNKPSTDNALLGPVAAGGNRNGYYFNRREGQVLLNLAEIHISKEADAKTAGFSIRLVDGEVVKGLLDGSTSNIWEAYGTLLVPIGGKSLKVDGGLLPTHVGYETIAVGTNNFLSKSFHFGQLQPFYVAGVRASYPLSEKTTFVGYIQNRYNGVYRNANSSNRDMGFGFQLAHVLNPTSTVYLNGLTAKDAVLGDTQHDILNLVYSGKIGASTMVALDASYSRYKSIGGVGAKETASGVTAYVAHTMKNGNVAAIRAETLSDSARAFATTTGSGSIGDPFVTSLNQAGLVPSVNIGQKPSLSSVSLSYELKGAASNGRTILEARFDFSNSAIFPTENSAKKSQTTLTLAQIFSF